MRILLSAFACHPEEGSESGIGWNWAYNLAKSGHEVSVLTREYYRASTERKPKELGLPNLRFEYVDVSVLPYWIPIVDVYPYYLCWQWNAFSQARRLHRARPFDIIHHVTFSAFRFWSLLFLLEAPFIFGPVGGGERSPMALRASMPRKARFRERIRDIGNLLPRFDPVWRLMLRKSARIAVTTESTLACLPRCRRAQAFVSYDNMLADAPCCAGESGRGKPFKLLYAGRLIYWKGLLLALRALASLKGQVELQFTIAGRGGEEPRLREEVSRLGLQAAVAFIPWTPRAEVLALHATHDAFLFPSLHDSGGTAVLEAISHGKPVICLDSGGPAVIVDEYCARVVETTKKTEEQVCRGIADAILELCTMSGEKWKEMRLAAVRRARYHEPALVIARIYGSLLVPNELDSHGLSDSGLVGKNSQEK